MEGGGKRFILGFSNTYLELTECRNPW